MDGRLKNNIHALRFVSEFLKDFNGTKAAIRAGYSESSASHQARRPLELPEVLRAVGEGMEHLLKYNNVTAHRVIQELAYIAFFDPAALFGDDGKLLSIHQMPVYARRALVNIEIHELYRRDNNRRENVGLKGKVRWGDKLQALKTLAKCITLLKELEDAKMMGAKPSAPDLYARVFGRFSDFHDSGLGNDDGTAADADDLAGDVGGKIAGEK